MLLEIHPDNPDQRKIDQAVQVLRNGGLVIYPTDTIYSIGCDLMKPKAIEKIARIKDIKPGKAHFSIVCQDLSHISEYTKPFDNTIYKLMKRALPGPYTFILNAANLVPKLFKTNKKTIGIRVPDNNIALALVAALGNPIIATSVHDDDEVLEYTTDPELIHEKYERHVDMVINGGYGKNVASTIYDCTDGVELIRQGEGPDIS